MSSPKPEMSSKVVVLGVSNVGKTSIVSRSVLGSFSASEQPTLGTAFSLKVVNCESVTINLQIWDTAGQERFRALAPMYYHNANVALLVFDLSCQESLEGARQWAAQLKMHSDMQTIIYLIGNKCDLMDVRTVTPVEGQRLADELSAFYFETSASLGTNIDELFLHIGLQVAQMARQRRAEPLVAAPQPAVQKRRRFC
jgi:small GTP-binding protein